MYGHDSLIALVKACRSLQSQENDQQISVFIIEKNARFIEGFISNTVTCY